MSQTKYYPALSDIVTINDLPEALNFLEEGIQILFSRIYYKNLQFSKSIRGDSAFYSLDIVSTKKLAIELPGTGIFLVLNPDHQDHSISSFPLTVEWEWKVLAFRAYFKLDNFSFSINDYFNLLIDVFNIDESYSLDLAVRKFVIPYNQSISRVHQLVDDLNLYYNISIAYPINIDTEFDDIILQLHDQANVTAYEAIMLIYIMIGSLNEQQDRLNSFF